MNQHCNSHFRLASSVSKPHFVAGRLHTSHSSCVLRPASCVSTQNSITKGLRTSYSFGVLNQQSVAGRLHTSRSSCVLRPASCVSKQNSVLGRLQTSDPSSPRIPSIFGIITSSITVHGGPGNISVHCQPTNRVTLMRDAGRRTQDAGRTERDKTLSHTIELRDRQAMALHDQRPRYPLEKRISYV